MYRTQYKPGGLFGQGWCNALMNMLLSTPNDGVAEIAYSSPGAGATVFDTTIGQCHAEDMNWPPSFWDTARNKEISAAAAR